MFRTTYHVGRSAMTVRVTTLLNPESLPKGTMVSTGGHYYCGSCGEYISQSRTTDEPYCMVCGPMQYICTVFVHQDSNEGLLTYGREQLRYFPTLTFIGLAEPSDGRYHLIRKCHLTLTGGAAAPTTRYGGSAGLMTWLRRAWFNLCHGGGRN